MKLQKIVSLLLKYLIIGLRPLLGPDAHCKFTVSCTPYAMHQLETLPLFQAIISIFKRLMSCRPF